MAPTKKRHIFRQFYVRGHVAQEYILPLRDQKQVIANCKTLYTAEQVAVPAVSYLRAKQLFGAPELDKLGGSTGATSRSQFTAPSDQGDG